LPPLNLNYFKLENNNNNITSSKVSLIDGDEELGGYCNSLCYLAIY